MTNQTFPQPNLIKIPQFTALLRIISKQMVDLKQKRSHELDRKCIDASGVLRNVVPAVWTKTIHPTFCFVEQQEQSNWSAEATIHLHELLPF